MLALGSMVPLGCKKEEPRREMAAAQANSAASSTPPEIVVPQAATAKSGTPPLKVAITWTDPAAWERLPQASPMRAASYKIPLVAGEEGKAEMAVFYFGPGQGGDIDGNVDRWAKQFGKTLSTVKRENRQVNGLRQHVVEIDKGDYSSDMMGRSGKQMKDYAMLAAIVEAPSGSYFFKLTGPHKSVAAQRDAFYQLLDSIKTRE